ncbi:nuclear transport factor 2 family protein [Natronorubrum sp. FCH18a]|uniref:nuclear transport factor 2 family protein n=1 Tax=Natronorubrum sp. FCH18a TaxID=3447018 RepID=UPI003F514C31
MSEGPETVVRDYYDALRNGDPLEPFFRADESTVKFGISEALFGYDEVSDALREQTETTAEWSVESQNLVVTDRDEVATFADEVTMAWTDTESGERRRFDTRWSGALVRAAEASEADQTDDHEWLFTTMHVSTPDDL